MVHVRTPVPLRGEGWTTSAEFEVSAGDEVPFVLMWHPSHECAPPPIDPVHAVDATAHQWREWTRACTYEGEWREAVVRSLITLKALTYMPAGGIVAAPTRSSPEHIGGKRNWDYRYCWLRDSTFALAALMQSGYVDEAKAWRLLACRQLRTDGTNR
jgi:GH15 family glucan-1,4-alpha-glucosidase